MTHDPAIATAADYADALMSARRAKNILLLLLLLIVLGQIVLFFLTRYDVLKLDAGSTAAATPTTGAVESAAAPTTQPAPSTVMSLPQYLIGISNYVGIAGAIVLSLVLLLLASIMLVGRLIGVGRLTSAFLLSLLVIVLLFPWQALLNNANMDAPEFKVPGVLYTWNELTSPKSGAHFDVSDTLRAILKWARYVAFPLLALILLLMIQVKSNRGLRQALGEETYTSQTGSEIDQEVSTT